jgi:hypothetical protein
MIILYFIYKDKINRLYLLNSLIVKDFLSFKINFLNMLLYLFYTWIFYLLLYFQDWKFSIIKNKSKL